MELPSAIGHIVLDVETCAGCSICEAVCALNHEGMVSPQFTRLKITDYYLEGHRIESFLCKQCSGAECVRVCRPKALYPDKKTAAKVIDPEKCTGCKLCMVACPQHPNTPIFYDSVRKVCFKCDLCGGDPLCVKFCPEGALRLSKEVV